jgi:hypothetical protein
MKKLVLFSMLMGGFIAADAQNAPSVIPQQLKNKAVSVPIRKNDGTEVIGKLLREPNPYTAASAAGLDPNETIIGQTTYDLQTNASVQNRIYQNSNGGISAVWTYSQSNDLDAPDRGTGYNYNGGSWGAQPTGRLESKRTGWPSITTLANGSEYTIAHNTADEQLQLTYRSAAGTGAWTEDITKLPSPIPTGNWWPRMVRGGADGNSLHVISVTYPVANGGTVYNGQDGAPCYSRSTDGGATWDIVNVVLPELDNTNYLGFSGDNYAWAESQGNTIAFVIGDNFEDIILMKSTDNGDTWTKTIVYDFPYDMFDEATTEVLDTPNTSDGAYAIMLDDNGEAHVFWGAMRVLNDVLGDDQTSYFPFTDGLCYWNESMGAGAVADTIAFSVDADQSGTLDWIEAGLYYVSVTGFPSVSLADNGDIYVSYAGLHDNLNNGSQNYRHIYAIKSTDGGNSWSEPNDVTPFEDFAENVFASLNPTNDGNCIPMIYQRDFEPGLAARGDEDPFDVNEIVYLCIPSTLDVGVEEQQNIIDEFSVYPNPAGTSTKVSFAVNTAGNVVINVLDVRGQLISSYSNKVPAGRSSLEINVENFASGVYFINAQIGGDVKTQKLMVK